MTKKTEQDVKTQAALEDYRETNRFLRVENERLTQELASKEDWSSRFKAIIGADRPDTAGNVVIRIKSALEGYANCKHGMESCICTEKARAALWGLP
jgi:hypothetical protein